MCKEAMIVIRGAGGEGPWKIFASPGKVCWTKFKTIGHSSKVFRPSQKTLRTPWCPKLVMCLKEAYVKKKHCCQKKRIFGTNAPSKQGRIQVGSIAHPKI